MLYPEKNLNLVASRTVSWFHYCQFLSDSVKNNFAAACL